MKKLKSNLDERQEQTLLRIEHNGCWLAFWGLFIVIVAEYLIFGYEDVKVYAGEWIVFMILAFYIAVDCTRNGIFDRRLKPNNKTYIVGSALGGLVSAVSVGIVQYRRFPEYLNITLIMAGFVFVLTFVLIYVSMRITAKKVEKKNQEAERAYDEE